MGEDAQRKLAVCGNSRFGDRQVGVALRSIRNHDAGLASGSLLYAVGAH
jgi:hypothetical protein